MLVLGGAGGAAIWWANARSAEPAAAPAASASPAVTYDALPAGDVSAQLPDATAMGVVDLRVVNFPNVLAFYRDAVGLTVIEEGENHAVLGFDEPLIRLEGTTDPLDAMSDAGLYHSAILFADPASLAQALVRIAEVAPQAYQGAADHAVSLAFYFGDPEGNGLELYVDRPREEWVWEDGRVTMGSAALDVNAFVQEHLGAEAAGTATMGHVHLRVGDLADARAFYEGVLGFDVTAESDGALFYSAGGYHHHLATNTWQSQGAGPRSVAAGLGSFTIAVPTLTDVADIAARLDAANITYERTETGIVTADPWANSIRIVTV